ncbi:autotransporter outer membrane beta-barrel domain-containing protein [Skermanella stibiiresistens]|uniref:autotransporter outer membrane beta-barrel domain-containing protein n=1 Tax=Skermanella stibiiresistens TaxID=913326 RepID=UPI0012FBED0A|nr:autotransporter outer membrane beta-barrel domain-containing protein [Skermanella stibiiresistens]
MTDAVVVDANASVTNRGTIATSLSPAAAAAVYAVRTGAGAFTNTSTGTITATGNAIAGTSDSTQVYAVRAAGTLVNDGAISVTGSATSVPTGGNEGVVVGVRVDGDASTLTNTGTISATGAIITPVGTGAAPEVGKVQGVRLNGLANTLTNSGTITGTKDGVRVQSRATGTVTTIINEAGGVIRGAQDTGISGRAAAAGATTAAPGANGGANGIVINRGLIEGLGDDGIDFSSVSGSTRIDNHGTIRASGSVDPLGQAGTETNEAITINAGTVNNFAGGVIQSQHHGIYFVVSASDSPLATGAGTVVNQGSVIGEQGYGIRFFGAFNDSVTNTGVISGGNGTAIDFGAGDDSLALGTGSVVTGAVNGGAGADGVTLTGTGSHAGTFLNFETLTVSGANSAWTLSGASTFGGAGTTVAAGTLTSTGRLLGKVAVASGARLNASGATGALTNSGTLAIGDGAISALTVAGDFAQGAGSVWEVDIDAVGGNDKLTADGGATLAGGTIALTGASGEYQRNTVYTLLTAAGGVTGTFADVTSNLPALGFTFLKPELGYTVSDVRMSLVFSDTTFASAARGAAESRVATSLDHVKRTAGGSLAPVLDEVARMTPSQARTAFAQLDPEVAAINAGIGSVSATRVAGLVSRRLGQVGAGALAATPGASSFAGPQFSFAGTDGDFGHGAPLAAFGGMSSDPGAAWGGWARGYGMLGHADASGGVGGSDSRTAGTAMGLDYRLTDDLTVGVFGGYSRTDLSYDGRSDDTDIDSWQAGVYGGLTIGNSYVNAQAGYARNTHESVRVVQVGASTFRPRADYDGHEFNGYLEAGHRFHLADGFGLQPLVSLQAGQIVQDAYSETGAAGVRVEKATSESLRPSVEVRLDRAFTVSDDGAKLTPELRVRYARELLDTDQSVTASFVGATGGSFVVPGRSGSRDIVGLGAGVTAAAADGVAWFLDYDAELRDDQNVQAISAGLRLSW